MSKVSTDHRGGSPGGPIVVTHQTGLRFAARVGSHQVITDQPERGGGTDAGPTPLDLLGAALGSCVALYVHQFLETRHLPVDPLRVEVVQHSALNPHRVARFDVSVVVSNEIPPVYRQMIEAAARVCPAHNTLAGGSKVSVAIQFDARVPAVIPAG